MRLISMGFAIGVILAGSIGYYYYYDATHISADELWGMVERR